MQPEGCPFLYPRIVDASKFILLVHFLALPGIVFYYENIRNDLQRLNRHLLLRQGDGP